MVYTKIFQPFKGQTMQNTTDIDKIVFDRCSPHQIIQFVISLFFINIHIFLFLFEA